MTGFAYEKETLKGKEQRIEQRETCCKVLLSILALIYNLERFTGYSQLLCNLNLYSISSWILQVCSTSTCLSFLSRVLFQLISLNSFHFTAHQFSNLVSNFLSRYSQRHYVGNAPPEYLLPPALECSIAKAFLPSPLERVLILWSFLISVSISTFLFLSFCSREFETSSWCVFSFVALICRTRNNYLARFWFQLTFLPSPPSPLYHSARPSISFIAWKWSGAILVIVSSPRGVGEVGEGEWGSKSRGTFWLFYLSIWICCASFRISFFFSSSLLLFVICLARGEYGGGG